MFCKKLSIFKFFLAREIHFILIYSRQISLIHSLSFSFLPHYFLPCMSAGVYMEPGTHSLMNIVFLLISHWIISSLSLKPPFFSHPSQLNLVLPSLPLVSPQLPCPSVLAVLNMYVHKSCRFLNFVLAFFHHLHLSVSQKSPKQGFSFSITLPLIQSSGQDTPTRHSLYQTSGCPLSHTPQTMFTPPASHRSSQSVRYP